MNLTRDELTAWIRYIHEICGVFLDSSQRYLIETRLEPLLRETASDNWSELIFKAKGAGTLRAKIINAITTNETSFFRDAIPFELLRLKLIPEIIDRRSKAGMKPVPLRILSAACSTGQEAYSTAIVLKELLGSFSGYDIRILGLDISDAVITQAGYAHFSRLDIDRGLTREKLDQHFLKVGERWKIKDELRAMVTFRKANLLDPLTAPTLFDIIFCRNVAIYFTEPDKIRLFRNLGHLLAPDGTLIIGSTESIAGLCPEFEPYRHKRAVYYRKKECGECGNKKAK